MMKSLAETGNGWMTFKDACKIESDFHPRPRRALFKSLHRNCRNQLGRGNGRL